MSSSSVLQDEHRPVQATAAAENTTRSYRQPHVCFVAPHLWPVLSGDASLRFVGGAEVQQSQLARLLVRNGHAVTVISEDYGQAKETWLDGIRVLSTFRAQDGIPVLRFVYPRLTSIWQALHQADADVYYVRAAGMILAIVAAYCRRHGKKSIYAGASDSDFDPSKQLIKFRRDRWLYHKGLAQVDAIVVQNETQKQLCRQHYGRSSTLIPSLYELPEQAGGTRGDCILWVAVMRRGKRPELFFELARKLPQRRFVMIGGPDGDSAEAQTFFAATARQAAELTNLEFHGFLPLPQVEQHFERARVVVNTSLIEGMPNTFLQAWARGVPTLAFYDTGAKIDGKPVHPVVADVAEGAATLECLCTNADEYNRYARRCREYFNRQHSGAGILAQYRGLLDTLATG